MVDKEHPTSPWFTITNGNTGFEASEPGATAKNKEEVGSLVYKGWSEKVLEKVTFQLGWSQLRTSQSPQGQNEIKGDAFREIGSSQTLRVLHEGGWN